MPRDRSAAPPPRPAPRPRCSATRPACGDQAEAATAARFLARKDRRLAELIRRIGPGGPALIRDPFAALVGSIVHQQVSLSAGAAMYRRLKTRCPRGRLTAGAVRQLTDADLRAAGLSRQKAAYVRGIAEAFATRRLTARRLRALPDEQVIEAATQLKGVGRWTAEMLLIFCLGRPDVWPVDDFGLRKAAQQFLGRNEPPRPAELAELGEPWRPYRTYAAWYLWRSLERQLPPAVTR